MTHSIPLPITLPGHWLMIGSEDHAGEARAVATVRLDSDGCLDRVTAVIADPELDADGGLLDERQLRFELGARGFEALIDRAGLVVAGRRCIEAGAMPFVGTAPSPLPSDATVPAVHPASPVSSTGSASPVDDEELLTRDEIDEIDENVSRPATPPVDSAVAGDADSRSTAPEVQTTPGASRLTDEEALAEAGGVSGLCCREGARFGCTRPVGHDGGHPPHTDGTVCWRVYRSHRGVDDWDDVSPTNVDAWFALEKRLIELYGCRGIEQESGQ